MSNFKMSETFQIDCVTWKESNRRDNVAVMYSTRITAVLMKRANRARVPHLETPTNYGSVTRVDNDSSRLFGLE